GKSRLCVIHAPSKSEILPDPPGPIAAGEERTQEAVLYPDCIGGRGAAIILSPTRAGRPKFKRNCGKARLAQDQASDPRGPVVSRGSSGSRAGAARNGPKNATRPGSLGWIFGRCAAGRASGSGCDAEPRTGTTFDGPIHTGNRPRE